MTASCGWVNVGGGVRVSHTACIDAALTLDERGEASCGCSRLSRRTAYRFSPQRIDDVADRAALLRLDRSVVAVVREPRVGDAAKHAPRRARGPTYASPACRPCCATHPARCAGRLGSRRYTMPATGMTIAIIASTLAVAWIMSPSAQASVSTSRCLPRLAQAVPISRGSAKIAVAQCAEEQRNNDHHPHGHDDARPRLEQPRGRIAPPPRQHAEQRWLDAASRGRELR